MSDAILFERRFEIHKGVSPEGYPVFVLWLYTSSMFHSSCKELARNADKAVLEAAIAFLEGKDESSLSGRDHVAP